MNKNLSSIVLAGICGLMLFSPSLVAAQSGNSGSDSGSGQGENANTDTQTQQANNNQQQNAGETQELLVQERIQSNRMSPEDFKRNQNEVRQLAGEERCNGVRNNITNRNTRYQNNFDEYSDRYVRMMNRIKAATLRLTELGLDTSAVTTLLDDMDVLVSSFESEFVVLSETLNSFSDVACDENGNDVAKTLVGKAKADLKDIRTAGQAIHNFVQTQLKPAFQDLQSQVADAGTDQ